MADDETRLLLDIKGDLGETKGLVSELRIELREHRQEDRADLGEVKTRLGEIEARQAQMAGAETIRRQGEAKRAGIVAAVVAGAIGIVTQLVEYLRH